MLRWLGVALSYAQFLSSLHPLSGHFRAALGREGHLRGSVPVSAIAVYDTKLNNLCKFLNPEVESNPFLVMLLVLRAAAKIPGSVSISEDRRSIQRLNSYPPEIIQSLTEQQSSLPENILIEVIRIPYSAEKPVETLTLHISANGYYLDVIAAELGAPDASEVLVSRTVGKASSETRLYFWPPESYLLDLSKEPCARDACQFERSLNSRASYFSGQVIYGDAILASIGYSRRSLDLFYEDVSLRSYHRSLSYFICSILCSF
ncbi:unnamed protein product [Ilex paraguariensis]|uniref:Small RNA 2'-O-methyltransferase Hen1 La-motif C-terminal domain-containing protein n=1 Tax=Ilex paraguariensis TaxID=185542 RepID=A0ABC8T0E7_9AQUA